MELLMNFNNENYRLNLNNNIIFFGQNTLFKNEFLNNLSDGLCGKKKNISIINDATNLSEYNIILFNESSDFSNEFKFTKNNEFKNLIYDDVMKKINSDKIINYSNEIFDIIDKKVNKILDRKINNKLENNLSFEIEIPDISSIIDRFTNIYIDNVLLNDKNISKSMKRKLLYQLYFLNIKENDDKKTIVYIDNFDSYLSEEEIIDILNFIDKYTSDNCHFILSSCRNIFEYINLDYYYVYKICDDKLIDLYSIDKSIQNYLIKSQYNNNCNMSLESFIQKNKKLIMEYEISDVRNLLFNNYSFYIGKLLNCTEIKILKSKPKNINTEHIICADSKIRNILKEISSTFID